MHEVLAPHVDGLYTVYKWYSEWSPGSNRGSITWNLWPGRFSSFTLSGSHRSSRCSCLPRLELPSSQSALQAVGVCSSFMSSARAECRDDPTAFWRTLSSVESLILFLAEVSELDSAFRLLAAFRSQFAAFVTVLSQFGLSSQEGREHLALGIFMG